jgi:hypothetical protein
MLTQIELIWANNLIELKEKVNHFLRFKTNSVIDIQLDLRPEMRQRALIIYEPKD